MTLDVKIWGESIGKLSWNNKGGYAYFMFENDYVSKGINPTPLTMPFSEWKPNQFYIFEKNADSKCFKGLPSFIADSLPDKYGNEIIKAFYESRGLGETSITPLHQLSYIGKRGMGALEFFPTINFNEESSAIDVSVISELANDVLFKRSSFKDLLMQKDKNILDILKIGTSAGGAKPKAIIAYNPATNEVRSGQVKAPEGFGYYLIKFAGVSSKDNSLGGGKDEVGDGLSTHIGVLEYTYHLMAVAAGIKMSECSLLEENGKRHFMTKRFDRTPDGEKLHMITLAGIANRDRDLPHGYESLLSVASKLKLNNDCLDEIFRRMVFNVLARNNDDHTKNHAFLMDRNGRWSLAPAYDLCYSYDPTGRFTSHHQMYINGKNDDFTWKDFEEIASKWQILKFKEIVQEVTDAVCDWKKFAKETDLDKGIADFVDKNTISILPGKTYGIHETQRHTKSLMR